jgi:thioredoxin-like negative regulator of GroEL
VIARAIAALLALALAGCATTPEVAAPARPDAKAYAVTPDAMADVDAALARASANGKRVLVVLGANWCHDSTALAGWLQTPRFAALIAGRFELVFVNVGMPQTGDGHNLAVAQRFGLAEMKGTPALLVLDAGGKPLNPDTAASWRNAASRSEEAIFAELTTLADQPVP